MIEKNTLVARVMTTHLYIHIAGRTRVPHFGYRKVKQESNCATLPRAYVRFEYVRVCILQALCMLQVCM